ncbi:glycosyltransferase family 2 protein [Leptospira sp. WS4.C2]
MESKNPMVSVIIPTYNNGHLIEQAIGSVMDQSYRNWEIIVVDNFSFDNTKSVLEKYATETNIHFFQINNNGVIAKSRNFGIGKSAGEYIAFLDSDDWWHSSKLQKSLEALEGGADLVYHDLLEAESHSVSVLSKKVKTRKLKRPIFDDLLLNGNGIINSSVVVKKSILTTVGSISEDPKLIAWEDFEYWLRISQVTEKFTRIPSCLGYYWVGGGNVSNPQRTLIILNEIQRRYSIFFDEFARRGFFPSWIHYGILSSLVETGQLKIKDMFPFFKKMSFKHKVKITIKSMLTALKI